MKKVNTFRENCALHVVKRITLYNTVYNIHILVHCICCICTENMGARCTPVATGKPTPLNVIYFCYCYYYYYYILVVPTGTYTSAPGLEAYFAFVYLGDTI